MKTTLYNKLFSKGRKSGLAVLVDPDKTSPSMFRMLSDKNCRPDVILIGGSHVSVSVDECIEQIKKHTDVPVVLFPGNPIQLSATADAMMLLMLLSGRNAEYLIGHHVVAAPFLRHNNTETISTGYILIGGNGSTSVEYITQTRAIPADKTDIIKATAIAGEMIGNKLIYLEAGSGAESCINKDVIKEVRSVVNVSLMVGGGIQTPENAKTAWKAGADFVVLGTILEKKPALLKDFLKARDGVR